MRWSVFSADLLVGHRGLSVYPSSVGIVFRQTPTAGCARFERFRCRGYPTLIVFENRKFRQFSRLIEWIHSALHQLARFPIALACELCLTRQSRGKSAEEEMPVLRE